MDTANINDGYPIFNYQNSILSVEDRNLSKNIIYPNPATKDIYFQRPLKNIIIYDLMGIKIIESNNIPISN